MEQLLCHLIGDYWLQNNKQATLKTTKIEWAILHGILYSIPFLFLIQDVFPLLIICISHIIIDRYRLSYKLCSFTNPELFNAPDYLKCWILIIQDNTIHLVINYLVIKNFSL